MREVMPRSRRANSSTPATNRTIATIATGISVAQSNWAASGWWWAVQPHQVRFAMPLNAGTAAW